MKRSSNYSRKMMIANDLKYYCVSNEAHFVEMI
jgi:hypothetical protein